MTGVKGYAHTTVDLYATEAYVVWCHKARKRLRKRLPFMLKDPGATGLTEFSVWHPKKGVRGLPRAHLVVWVNVDHHETLPQLVDTIAHEATHGALRILEWVQVPVNGDSSEAYAYLVGWLTRWMLESVGTDAA